MRKTKKGENNMNRIYIKQRKGKKQKRKTKIREAADREEIKTSIDRKLTS